MNMRVLRSFLGVAAAALAGIALAASPASAELSHAMRLASIETANVAENGTAPPGLEVIARVDISEQAMYVYLGEELLHVFPVSTGKPGYGTPVGRYQAQWQVAQWRSRKYNNAPMPWAVFFLGGYAVHGTTDVRRLGSPASHGCIRLQPANAKIFFTLVERSGLDSTLISVVE